MVDGAGDESGVPAGGVKPRVNRVALNAPSSQAVWFAYTPDRKVIHPQQHLESFSGKSQADAYGGYQAIYETISCKLGSRPCWRQGSSQVD
jgi:hypothetical protein